MPSALLPHAALAARHFGGDAGWFVDNIPFFACSDPQIERSYYYRWRLWRSHLRDLGDRGHIVTEFLDDVGWSLKPYESLNDATAYHILEGRWLRDRRYVDEYVDFLYHGGNDRHFSEAIADAAYGHYLVHKDRAAALKNLEAMRRIYRQWDDHYDPMRGLYFIEPLLDATEYTISSIDASGGRDGFRGGDAFRPSINSFQFANARAIAALSQLAGDERAAREFADRADALRAKVHEALWSESLAHFIDRYQVSTPSVKPWETIRGRELAGYTPWYFSLPDRDPRYVASWAHLLDPGRLAGPFGLRTVEPSYEYYQRQYRYVVEDGVRKPECQWNGPSWPFQTTLALGGLANLLHDYPAQTVIGTGDYLRLLRQYTRQHYRDGRPDLQEDYDPDTGSVVVGLKRSHHYNHSGYNDLIITGLVGLRPRADDVLEVNPLIPAGGESPLTYLCLEKVPYHGRLVTVVYDRDGRRFGRGKGLSVFVDGKRAAGPSPLRRLRLPLAPKVAPRSPATANRAVNLTRAGFPAPGASVNATPEALFAAIDGRVWFYPEVPHHWTNTGSTNPSDWFSLSLEKPETLDTVRLAFFGDGARFRAPERVTVQYGSDGAWKDVRLAGSAPRPVENGRTTIAFAPVRTDRIRIVFPNRPRAAVALVELAVFGETRVAPRELPRPYRPAGMPLQPEGLEAQNSETGEFNGVRWRHARDGCFFAFRLPIVAGGPNALVVSYWGSDAGNRRFEILIDGQKLAEQTLENNRPGVFYDVAYPIPPELTRDRASVQIRFQARPGATAGGVFGAKLVRR